MPDSLRPGLFSLWKLPLLVFLRPAYSTQLLARRGWVQAHELGPRVRVRKPHIDARDYLHATFDSGLKVLAVRDPHAEKAGFGMAVEAGSLEDPEAFQGLAHFCEHMLFLGSQKYPDPGAFARHLGHWGGDHNAFTSPDKTVFFNEVGNGGLDEALDMFAQFFIAPRFDTAMVEKEIHAVNSEHRKNKLVAQKRLWHLLRSKANPRHPIHQFATGNLESLRTQPEKKGKSLHEALRLFHTRNYCSRRLHLVLLANRTVDEQLDLAHQYFGTLPKASLESCPDRPDYGQVTAYSRDLGNIGLRFTLGTQGAPQLWAMFPMPPLKSRYRTHAEAYLILQLSHYGPGSLKTLLANEDLSHSYSCFSQDTAAGSAIFVTFALTEKGVAKSEQILHYFFAYTNAIRNTGVNRNLLLNMKRLQQALFDYPEGRPSERSLVERLAEASVSYAPTDLLTGGQLIDDPDPHLVRQVLELIAPDNMNVALITPGFDERTASHHDRYFDFGYQETALGSDVIESLGRAKDERLAPLRELQYVPHQLDVIREGADLKEGPTLLMRQGRVELWWVGVPAETMQKVPKAIVKLKIGFSPQIVDRVEEVVLANMHVRLIQRELEEDVDALQTCGLSYTLFASDGGLEVSFQGFDEHILELAELVLPLLRHSGFSKESFDMVRRQLLLDLDDVTRGQPYHLALEALDVATVTGRHSRGELKRAASDATLVNQVGHRKFVQELFRDAEIAALFTGNIGRQRAQDMMKRMESLVQITRDQQDVSHNAQMQVFSPRENVEIRMPNPIPGDKNSVTLVTYQLGVPTVAERVKLMMLSTLIERPVFDALRTQRQLGYVVHGYVASHVSIVEVRVVVQGAREDPDEVEALIDSTMANVTARIANMDAVDFDRRREGLRGGLLSKDNNFGDFAQRYWPAIFDQTYCFNMDELQVEYIDSGLFDSPKSLVALWEKFVTASKTRKKVVVKLFGSGVSGELPHKERDAAGANSRHLLRTAGTHRKKVVVVRPGSGNLGSCLVGEAMWPRTYVCSKEAAWE